MRLFLPIILSGVASGIGLWATLNVAVWPWQVVTLVCAALTVLATLHALRQRQRTISLPRAAWQRLALAGVVMLALALTSVTVGLAYQRGVGLVRAKHIPVECMPAAADLTEYEAVSFTTSDGLTLRGWYAPARNDAVIVLVHGLNGNRCGMLPEAALLWQAGYGVLLFDLRGCGESEGEVVTLGYNEVNDVRAAVGFALKQPGVSRVGLLGHSMGGATVIRAAARLPEVSAVVAQSTFTSLADNVANGVEKVVGLPPFPFAPLVVAFAERESGVRLNDVRPIDDLPALAPRPILIVHGALDDLIPVANAHALYAAAQEPKELYLLPTAGHADLLQIGGVEYVQRLTGFFDRYLLPPP